MHLKPSYKERQPMTNLVIRSDEANAAATALVLAAMEHNVCLLAPTLLPGEHTFEYLGKERTVTLRKRDELDTSKPTVGVIFAEGENVRSGVARVLDARHPDLLVIIGGGILAATEADAAAEALNFDTSRVLMVGAFLVGGNSSIVRAEKQGVLAGFLAPGTPPSIVELAESTFPQVSIGDSNAVALSSVNALFHVPPMILNAMSIERGDDVRIYVEGFGDSVCRLLLELDSDRLHLGAALGLSLVPIDELNSRYSGSAATSGKPLRERVNTLRSTQSIKIPADFNHRFLAHELRATFAPMSELARALGVDLPTIQSVVRIGEILLGTKLTLEANDTAQKFLSIMDSKAHFA